MSRDDKLDPEHADILFRVDLSDMMINAARAVTPLATATEKAIIDAEIEKLRADMGCKPRTLFLVMHAINERLKKYPKYRDLAYIGIPDTVGMRYHLRQEK
ncbi:MAG: hypothetical protein WCX22_01910 [Methanoregula sp.]